MSATTTESSATTTSATEPTTALGQIMRNLARGAAASVFVLLLALFAFLAQGSRRSLQAFGLGFVTGTEWDPAHGRYGALPFLFGTLLSSLLALAIAVPGGFLVALYVAELGPRRVRGPISALVETLAAVPSVVYGVWGVFVLAPAVQSAAPHISRALGFLPFFRGPSQGVGMLTTALVLALMVLPTIAAVMRDVLSAVPTSLREAGLALGGTQWEVLRHVVFPHARAGLFAAVMLGFGRAVGETMAVTMVIGNSAEISTSLFAPGSTAASVLANELAEASDPLHASALEEVALVLLVVTVLFNLGAHGVVRRYLRRKTAGLSTGPAEGELGEAP